MPQESTIFYSKSDFSKAFRILPILVGQRKWLIMMAIHPITKQKWYFIDLCLPFGSSRSCTLFQRFSDGIQCIMQHRFANIFLMEVAISNYLDDFLFMALCLEVSNGAVKEFLVVCAIIGCPVSMDKTEYASELIIFLGVLLCGNRKLLIVPDDKKTKAMNLLKYATEKRKVTI